MKPLKHTGKFWPISLVCSLALTYLGAMIFLTNPYGFYTIRKIAAGLLIVPFLTVGILYMFGVFWTGRNQSIPRKDIFSLLVLSGLVAATLTFIFPNSRPLISQYHRLELIASGDKNEQSAGSVVEVRQIRTLDGKNFPLDQLTLTGNWQITDGVLLSTRGSPETSASFYGNFSGGVVLSLRYIEDGGKIIIHWDGEEKTIDLYSTPATIEDFVYDGFSWEQLSPLQSALIVMTYGLYFLGLTTAVFLFFILVRAGLFRLRIGKGLLILVFLAITVIFIHEKFSYYDFSGVRPFRDSRSYVQNADLPINSWAFWTGERPFTLPLILKILDVHEADGWSHLVMERVRTFQYWLSIVSWVVFGLVVSIRVRQTWLKPVAFGFILAFSLALEIGTWDNLMLSESVSISLFALLVAAWLGWQKLFEWKAKRWIQGSYLVILILLTVLYTFVRESNVYFVILAGLCLLLGIVLKKPEKNQRWITGVYILSILVIAFVQNLSLSSGNRWQVFMYDHLALRILVNDQARDFFVAHGLPISDSLMGIVNLYGYQYQDMIRNDPKLQPVKQWVEQYGVSTYLLYLISNPGKTLIEPIRQVPALLDGHVSLYYYPIFPSHPYSNRISDISKIFYFRSPPIEWLAGLLLLGGSLFWIAKSKFNSAWLVLAILTLSIYPMMFIIWHGEPMEIERHAIQIGIQFRLAAWIAFIFLVDAFTIGVLKGQPASANLESKGTL